MEFLIRHGDKEHPVTAEQATRFVKLGLIYESPEDTVDDLIVFHVEPPLTLDSIFHE